MKNLLLLSVLSCGLFCTLDGNAQSWQWGKGNTGDQMEGWGVATDTGGNVYCAGVIFDTSSSLIISTIGGYEAIFDGHALPGFNSIAWVKYSNSGAFLWAGGAQGVGGLYNITTDPAGNLVVFGYFNGALTIGPYTLTARGGQNFFLAKINPSGTVLWAINDGNVTEDFLLINGLYINGPGGVATDATGNIYVTGNFTSGVFEIGPHSFHNADPSGRTNDIFVAKYSPSGSLVWANSIGGNSDDYAFGINATAIGNVYICGAFYSDRLFVGPSVLTNPYGEHSIASGPMVPKAHICEFSAAGEPIWGQAAGGSQGAIASSLTSDALGNIYMTGGFWDTTIIFGATTITSSNPSYYDNSTLFLVAYSPSDIVTWNKTISCPRGGNVFGSSISLSGCGVIWVSAKFTGSTANIDGYSLSAPAEAADPVLIAGYNIFGGVYGFSALGSGGDDQNGIGCDQNGDVFLCSDNWLLLTSGFASFVIGSDTMADEPPWELMYVAKYTPGPHSLDPAAFSISANPGDTVCSGIPVTFSTTSSATIISYEWLVNGTIVSTAGSSYTYLPSSGDSVRCIVSASKGNCTGDTIMSSNTIKMVVDPILPPSPIAGAPELCQGATSVLTDSISGGTWASSNTAVATVGPHTGGVACIAVGIDTMSYTISTGCSVFKTITINPLPAHITGTGSVCQGDTAMLANATAGGMWSSGNSAIGMIGTATGIVTGIASGTAAITYNLLSGCGTVTAMVTINARPAAITGPDVVCVGAVISLDDSLTGGVWTSSHTSVATIGSLSGIATGVTAGITSISYAVTPGCSVARVITVNSLPTPITGTLNVCVGAGTVLGDATGSGLWTSSNTAIATIYSATGVAIGLSAGTTGITYTLTTGCGFATTTITINPLPDAITGILRVCVGDSVTLSYGVGGGMWSSGISGVAVTDSLTGVVTGVTAGATPIYYTLETGCSAMIRVLVNPSPSAYSVTGGGSYCAGGAGVDLGLTGSDPGVRYQLYYDASVTGSLISGTGFGLDFGLQTLAGVYTVIASDAATGCTENMPDSAVITINSIDSIGRTRDTAVCYISDVEHIILTAPVATGGVWYDGTSGITDTINAPGDYSFLYPDTAGCAIHCDTFHVVFVPLPAPISGNNTVCSGDTLMLSDFITGGTWTSSALSVATVNITNGIVSGMSAGVDTITYALLAGCSVTQTITIVAPPCTNGISTIVNNTLEFYPNPAADDLTIKMEGAAYNSLTITNNIGQQLIQQQIVRIANGTTVDIRTLPPGMYYITLKGENGLKVQKFVKL